MRTFLGGSLSCSPIGIGWTLRAGSSVVEAAPASNEKLAVAYTALRWGALLRRTPDDPQEFRVPSAPDWYRFVLQSPSVAVTMAAPHNRAELEQDLKVLAAAGPMPGRRASNT